MEEERIDLQIVNDLFADIAQNKIKAVCVAVIYNDDSFRIGWNGKASHLEKLGLFEQAKIDIAHTCFDEEGT